MRRGREQTRGGRESSKRTQGEKGVEETTMKGVAINRGELQIAKQRHETWWDWAGRRRIFSRYNTIDHTPCEERYLDQFFIVNSFDAVYCTSRTAIWSGDGPRILRLEGSMEPSKGWTLL